MYVQILVSVGIKKATSECTLICLSGCVSFLSALGFHSSSTQWRYSIFATQFFGGVENLTLFTIFFAGDQGFNHNILNSFI